MSDKIDFFKTYSRRSKSSWDDLARIVMLFDPDSKSGAYLHVGNFGFNGFSVSNRLIYRLPKSLQQQCIDVEYLSIVLHVFADDIEKYCTNPNNVSDEAFMSVFALTPKAFFSEEAKACWQEAFNVYMKKK